MFVLGGGGEHIFLSISVSCDLRVLCHVCYVLNFFLELCNVVVVAVVVVDSKLSHHSEDHGEDLSSRGCCCCCCYLTWYIIEIMISQ